MNSSLTPPNNDTGANNSSNSSPSKADTKFDSDRQDMMTEEQALADDEIWRVSSCDSDEEQIYNPKERNKDNYDDPEQL